MAGRRAIDVEDLLVWAYRDQRVREAAAALEGADWRLGFGPVSADGCAAVARAGELGYVPGRTPPASLFPVHDDALAVHEAVERQAAAWLLVLHASAGTRPTTASHARPRFEPVEWKPAKGGGLRAAVSYEIDPADGRHAYYCAVRLIDPRPWIEMTTALYARWHDGLAAVARHFAAAPNLLREHAVSGPAAASPAGLGKNDLTAAAKVD